MVSWVELISENFMPWRGESAIRQLDFLQDLRSKVPIALHGVSLNIGSADPLNFEYLTSLKRLIEHIEPFVVSDHLAWTGVDGLNSHDLLPLPYTEESLEHISRKVDQVQNYLGRPILLENPSSYLQFKGNDMSEAEFIQRLSKKAGSGLLLDLNNVYVCSVNHGFDPISYLKSLDSHFIAEIHLAGHSQRGSHLLDTHDNVVCEEVWELLHWTLNNFGPRNTMIERDGNIPSWDVLLKEISKIGEFHARPSSSL